MIGFSPVQDTDHWGAALNATYRTDWFNVQYIGGYRDLHYTNSLSTSGRNIDFAGDERAVGDPRQSHRSGRPAGATNTSPSATTATTAR